VDVAYLFLLSIVRPVSRRLLDGA